MKRLLLYYLRQIRPWARFRRFWHILFHLHCAIDIINADGSTVIMCQCGKSWGGMPAENEPILKLLRPNDTSSTM
jgi:hypothetical protein